MTDRPILFSGPMVRALLDGTKTQTRRVITGGNTSFDGSAWPKHVSTEEFKLDRAWIDDSFKDSTILKTPWENLGEEQIGRIRPKFEGGDRLWVQENWRCNGWATDVASIFYMANKNNSYTEMCEQFDNSDRVRLKIDGRWKPSIHMPRWVSRLTLVVTDVRVQRLNEISEEDAIAEGCRGFFDEENTEQVKCPNGGFIEMMPLRGAKDGFRTLWDSINGKPRGNGTDISWIANPWVVATTFTAHKCNIDKLGEVQ
jgi:hypothetical protein